MRVRDLLPGPRGLLWAGAAVVLAGTVVEPLRDQDMWWHLATGEWIAKNLSIPSVDPFPPAGGPARPWVVHEWLFEVALSALQRLGGEPLLVLVPPVLAAVCAAFVLRAVARRGVAPALGAPLALAALLPAHEYWVQRPQIVSYVLLAALVSELQAHRDSLRRRLWHWVPLMALWSNLHAASVLAPLAIAAHLAGGGVERLRGEEGAHGRLLHLLALLPAVIAAGLLNPNGPGLYAHALGYTQTGWHGIVLTEWLPPDLADPRRLAFLAAALGTLMLGAVSRAARPGDVFALGGFLLMALRWQRHVPLALIVAAPLLPCWASAIAGELRRGRGAATAPERVPFGLGLAHLGGLALLAAAALAARWPCAGAACEEAGAFPRGAVAFLARSEPAGRGLNYYDWGGYLLWRRPGREVFVDGRTCDIDLDRIAAYSQIHERREGWRDRIASEGIGWVLYPRKSALAQALATDGWAAGYEDETAVVLLRPGG